MRNRAIKLLNEAIKELTGGAVEMSDLPDTASLYAGLNELQKLLELAVEFSPTQELLDVAQEIACELLEEEGFPI